MEDFNQTEYQDTYIKGLVDFVAAEPFQTKFEKFFLTYAPEFTDDEELKLGYYERYKEFHAMFEEELEKFCRSMDITQPEFMRRCKMAANVDKKADHYIQILLSSVEFETFLKLMKLMRPIAIQRLKNMHGADSKPSASGAERKGGGGGARKASKGEPDLDFDKEADTLDIPDDDLEMEDMTSDAKDTGRSSRDDFGSKHK